MIWVSAEKADKSYLHIIYLIKTLVISKVESHTVLTAYILKTCLFSSIYKQIKLEVNHYLHRMGKHDKHMKKKNRDIAVIIEQFNLF